MTKPFVGGRPFILLKLAGVLTAGVLLIGLAACSNTGSENSPRSSQDWSHHPLNSALVTPAGPSGLSTAIGNSKVVGQDTGLLHLGFSSLPGTYIGAVWQSTGPAGRTTNEEESVELHADTATLKAMGVTDSHFSEAAVSVTLSHNRDTEDTLNDGKKITIKNRPAMEYQRHGKGEDGSAHPVGTRTIIWEPVSGLWETVSSVGTISESRLRDLVAAVKLDKLYRCVQPFQLSSIPGGSTPAKCTMNLIANPASNRQQETASQPTSYDLVRDGDRLGISVIPADKKNLEGYRHPDRSPDLTITGKPSWWQQDKDPNDTTDVSGRLTIGDGSSGPVFLIDVSGKSFGRADAIRLAQGLRLAEHPDQPTTWPVLTVS